MKRGLLHFKQQWLLVLFVSFLQLANAQVTVQIGTGTDVPANTLYFPVYRFSASSTTTACRSNIVFTQSEMAAAGIVNGSIITALQFNKTNQAHFLIPASYKLYMANTSNTALATTLTWASILSTHTEVYNNPAFDVQDAAGWFTIPVLPFVYTGGSLEIASDLVMTGNIAGASDMFKWEYTATVPTDKIVASTSANATILNSSTAGYKFRPNIKFTYLPVVPCTDPPTAGVATTAAANVCNGQKFNLGLSGATYGVSQTYQWQSSPDDATWTDLPGDTLMYNRLSQIGSHYYRCKLTCGANTVNSASVFVQSPSVGGNYTIDKNFPTGGSNFASFGEAIALLQCGISSAISFTVAPFSGPYNERVVIGEIGGASATNTITIKGNGATLTYSPTSSTDRAALVLDGADYVTIDSLNVDVSAGALYGWGIVLTGTADHNTIRNCNITTSTTSTSGNYLGIALNGSATGTGSSGNNANYNLFENNTIIGGYYSFYLYGSAVGHNAGNNFIGNKALEFYYAGFYVNYQRQTTLSGNDITRPTRTNTTACYGIYLLNTSDSMVVEKNRVHNMFEAMKASSSTCYSIYAPSSNGDYNYRNKMENNLVHTQENNSTLYGIYVAGKNWNVYHNTVILDYQDAAITTSTIAYGIYISADSVDVKNNISVVSRGGTGSKYCLYLGTSFVTGNINYNDWVLAASPSTNSYVTYKSVAYTNLDDWKLSNGNVYDQSSVSIDPLFQQLLPGDFYPSEPSINNLGENVGVTTDLAGQSRSATPDPGAFEFSVAACVNPPNAGTVSTVAMACANTNFNLDVSGNSVGEGITYQWQVSPDNANWSNIDVPMAVSSILVSQATSSYYRCLVKCNAGTAVPTPGVLVTSPNLAPAGTYTINSTQATGGTNFQSFGDAINFIACGIAGPITFNVAANSGPYADQIIIPSINNSSVVNTVTWNGNGNLVSFDATDGTKRAAIILDGADHMIIDSLNVDVSAGTTYGWGIALINQADSNIIRKCNILTSSTSTAIGNYVGIALNGSVGAPAVAGNNANYNLIENNTITGGYYGLYAYGNINAPNSGNMFVHNTLYDQYTGSIYLYAQRMAIVSGNDVSRPSRGNTTTSYGVFLSNCTDSMIVEKNKVHNMFDVLTSSTSTCYGVYVASSDGISSYRSKLENNLVYDQNNNGILYGIYVSGDYWNIYHNTVILNNLNSTTASASYGIYLSADSLNTKNNIVLLSRAGTGSKYCLYLSTTFTGNINNNDWFNNAVDGTPYIAYKTSGYTTLDAWKLSNAGVYDQNSVSIDPNYLPQATGTFLPSEPSINNMGEDVGVPTDILEVPRGANPDPGAFEFSVATCTNPPTAGVVTTVTNACANGNFTLDISGNSFGDGLSYQWQISPDNVNWSNIGSSSNVTSLSVSQTTSNYYRCLVQCQSGTPVPTAGVQVITQLAAAGTYTINKNLATGGGNFQSFTDAVGFISCGIAGPIVFNVEAFTGPYNEQVVINQVIGSSAANTVTWNGNGNVLSYSITDAANRGVLTLNGADHMIFDSLAIDASAGTYGFAVILTNSADSNTIRKCDIISDKSSTLTNYGGIIMSGGTAAANTAGHSGNGNLFEKNIITGGYYGIYMYGSSSDPILYNTASENVIKDFYNNGLYTYYSQHITFSKNDISRPSRSNAGSGDVVYVGISYGDMLVEKNRVHNLSDGVVGNNTVYAFNIGSGNGTAALPNRFENNMVYNIVNGAGSVYPVYALGANYWTIAHNTILLNDPTATGGSAFGMYVYGTECYVYNNIISISRGGTGNKYCLYLASNSLAASNNNILLMNSTSGVTNAIGYAGSAKTTLADWQSTGYDLSSVSVEPIFTDPINGDLTPQEPLIFTLGNAMAGVTTDILDITRRANNPTPGAYEIAGSLPVSLLNIDAVRAGADVKLSWATLTEFNNKGFEIERSLDGSHFRGVGFVKTKASNGSSTARLIYEFLDLAAPTSDIYYRLKQQDNNGRAQLSNVVRIKAFSSRRFEITSLFPNPVRGTDLRVLMTSQQTSNVMLVVTDVAGKTLLQQNETLVQGANTMKLNVRNLPAGSYFLRANCQDGCESAIRKFVVQ